MKRLSVLVIAIFFLVYLIPLGVRPLTLPDEFRYAEIPREIVAARDWVVPHLNGLRYFEKPILGYWLNAIGIVIFGENAFAIRFFSAIATGFSALCLFLLARSYGLSRYAGIFAAAVFLTCTEVFAVGTFSVLDNVFALFVTAAMTCFFFAHAEGLAWKRKALLALTGVFCGLAFLTKGFLAFAVPTVAVVPFLIWQRRSKEILRVPWLPLLTAVLVALPWCLMIHAREKDFWRYFFWIEHIKRFLHSSSAQHPEAFWFFIPFLIGGTFPWTVLLPAAISGLKHNRLNNPLVKYAICWFLFPFLLFSASRGKLPTYILPCFAPLALLISVGLLAKLDTGKRNEFKVPAFVVMAIVLVPAICLILNHVLPVDFKLYEKSETWKVALLAASLLTCAAGLFFAGTVKNPRKRLACFALSPVLLMFSVPFIVPEKFMGKKMPAGFLTQHADKIAPDDIIVSDNYLVSAIGWTYRRNDVLLVEKPGELKYGLRYDDSKHRMLNFDQLKELIEKNRGKKHIVIVTFTRRYEKYRDLLPKPDSEEIGQNFVFAQFGAQTAAEADSPPFQKATQLHNANRSETEPDGAGEGMQQPVLVQSLQLAAR